jgi:GH35 family endo-1,4-beta-xylanase
MRIFFCLFLILAGRLAALADWRTEADSRIEHIRKGDFTVEVKDGAGVAIPVRRAAYELKHHAFWFGTAIAYAPFADPGPDGRAYRDFILRNFSALVCENEMKWYDNEATRGQEDYSQGDALLAFAEQNGLAMRGHNLFWEKEKYAMPWLVALDAPSLRAAVDRRLTDTVTRYRGRVVCWDVNNEMLDGSFFRSRLGPDIVPQIFRRAAQLDPSAPLFVNEYGVLGNPAKTERLIALIKDLQAKGAPVGGIGLQSHDSDRLTADPSAPLMGDDRPDWMLRTPLTPALFLGTLDRLSGETHLPIHLTEISAKTPDPVRRADDLEMLFRLGFSHPAVHAVVLWGFGAKTHWMGPDAALMNADNTLNAAGVRISHLLREVWTTRGLVDHPPGDQISFRGFYGDYTLKITLADGREIEREVRLSEAAPRAVVRL